MKEKYLLSLERLRKYVIENNEIPNEKVWNRIALDENLLSSKSITYFSGVGFNALCRKLIKKGSKGKL